MHEILNNLIESLSPTDIIIGVIILMAVCVIAKYVIRAFWRGMFK